MCLYIADVASTRQANGRAQRSSRIKPGMARSVAMVVGIESVGRHVTPHQVAPEDVTALSALDQALQREDVQGTCLVPFFLEETESFTVVIDFRFDFIRLKGCEGGTFVRVCGCSFDQCP